MGRWGRGAALLGVLLCAALGPASRAAAQTPAQRAEARRALEDAQRHYEAGRYALAADGYLGAHELLVAMGNARAPLALWNAGEAVSRVPGREVEAVSTLQRFLDSSGALTGDARVRTDRAHAEGLIAELRARRPEAFEGGRGVQPSPIGPVVLAVGGVTLATGVVLGVLAFADGESLRQDCPDGVCPGSRRGDVDSLNTLSVTADVLWIGGAVVAAVGLVLTLTLTEPTSPDAPAATARLGCGPAFCGASVAGRW